VASLAPASSVWEATANAPLALPALPGDVEHEIAIIGAGFTGLSAAHHLHKAGVDCVVLEANDAGWGASGRNGGMAVARYKKPFSVLNEKYGTATALRLHALIHEALDTLEATVAEHAIDCDFQRCGHVTPAHGKAAMATLEADVRWLKAEAGDAVPCMLDRAETARELGTERYVGAYLDPRAAGIHPLNYARGLAGALARRDVPIYVKTPAVSLREESGAVVIGTPRGQVRARRAILATNAYTSDMGRLHPDLHRRIIPVSTSVIATAPLSDSIAPAILPNGRLASDTKRIMHYFRLLPGRRLLLGGRGDLLGRERPESYLGLQKAVRLLFPQLGQVRIEHRWSGKVAVTLDDFPHIGRLSNRVFFALGYGGRGVALTNLMGKYLARLVQEQPIDAGPMGTNPFRPVPLHALRLPAMHLIAGYYRYLDARETTSA
jgi:glycine/D-amino acid oxidase-like deaminating enzyme